MNGVLTGLDRLVREGPSAAGLSPGAAVGLVAHPASVDARARHAVELLSASGGVALVRLFGPEHGLRGEARDMEPVADVGEDPVSGLPVVSLYGNTEDSLAPEAESLAGLEAVIYDLQDVGSRYYTYVYTLSYVMEAARRTGTRVIVLDRPNPIGGLRTEGPVLDPHLASFVGRYPIPVRHGMTTGELARLFNDAFGIGCALHIVEMTGWHRRMHFEQTALPWVAPSPNMPTPETARVYPGGCLVEGSNLSEGRGTTRPFELVGAPWVDAAALAETLRAEGLPGVAFRATSFRPEFHKHGGRSCHGVQLHVVERDSFRPFATYLELLRAARRQDPSAFAWREEAYEFVRDRLAIDLLLGRPELRPMLESDAPLREIEATWKPALKRFLELRRRFLIYPD